MTASRTGRVVAIVAYVAASCCEASNPLRSGFAWLIDVPTMSEARASYTLDCTLLKPNAARTASRVTTMITGRRVRMRASSR